MNDIVDTENFSLLPKNKLRQYHLMMAWKQDKVQLSQHMLVP